MGILEKFGTQTLKINISDDIDDKCAGVMGDYGTRSINVSILSDEGEVLEDSLVEIKMLVKTEEDLLIFSEGSYAGNGIYNVPFPDKCFEIEQDVQCLIRVSKGEEVIQSKIFTRHISKGLVGTMRDGKSSMIDLVKIIRFADKFDERMQDLTELGDSKTRLVITTADTKLTEYNDNHEAKVVEYDNNAKAKLEVLKKVEKSVKASESNVSDMKSSVIDNKQNFDIKYQGILDIVEAEQSRVEAENQRAEHDERIQNLLNNGLDSELEPYAKKTYVDSEVKKINDNLEGLENLLHKYNLILKGEE